MKRAMLAILVWVGVVTGFVVLMVLQDFHVGQIRLPRSQVVAISISLMVALTLVWGWLSLLLRLAMRRLRRPLRSSWLDHVGARLLLGGSLVASGPLWFYARYVEPNWIVVREVKLGEVDSAPPIRLVVISDLHLSPDQPTLTGDLVAAVNSCDADVVALLGDTLNTHRALPDLHRTLAQMRARHAKVAVRGNWDVWYYSKLPLLEGTGFEWLDGRVASLDVRGRRLHLVGFPFGDRAEGAVANRWLEALPRPGWRVFLYHTPDLFKRVPAADLYLTGHTHGGQVSLPFFGALVTLSRYGKRFERGLRRVGSTWLYTNPGIGVEPIFPYRLGVRPEVTLVLLGGVAGN